MKFTKLLSVQTTFGAYAALQRQAIFSEALYPQYMTWNRKTWKPEPTPKIKLIPWYLMSLLVFGVTIIFLYAAIREVISHEKDPEIGSTEALMLIFYICANVLASVAILTFVLNVEEICFVLRNVQTIKNLLNEDGVVVDDPSDLIGLFLHFMIPAPLSTPLAVCSVPILLHNIDPTYFWFRDYTFIPPPLKIFLRIAIMLFVVFHGAMVIFAFIIGTANGALAIHLCLKWMTRPKLFQQEDKSKKQEKASSSDFASNLDIRTLTRMSNVFTKLGKTAKFPQYFLKYRQLQIVTTVSNQLFSLISSTGMVVGLVGCCVCGYFCIKLSRIVPLPLTLLSIFILILISLACHALMPLLAEVSTKSKHFIRFWKLEGFSNYRKRQLKSLRPLSLSVGPFFVVTEKARGIFLSLALYYTATLVISV